MDSYTIAAFAVFSDMIEGMKNAINDINEITARNDDLLDEYNTYALISMIHGYDFSQEMAEIHAEIIENNQYLDYLDEVAEYGYDVA